MITKDGPKLYEYNVRFGDPECQVLMTRLKSDLLAALIATADGVQRFRPAVARRDRFDRRHGLEGLSGEYTRNTEIRGLERARALPGVGGVPCRHTPRRRRACCLGGLVLCVTARGKTVAEAQTRAYEAVRAIDWPDGFYRTDIGWRAVARERGDAMNVTAESEVRP